MTNLLFFFFINNWPLFLFLLIGAILRFYNIGWGAPYFFHPDERNIASSIARMHMSGSFNPQFFAYGCLSIYLVFFAGKVLAGITTSSHWLGFEEAIYLLRLTSSVFGLATGILIYKIADLLFKRKMLSYLGLALFIFSPGFIQAAHFGTFESILGFLYTLLFLICLLILKRKHVRYLFLAGAVLGLACSVKVSSLVFLPFPPLCYLATLKKRAIKYFIIHGLLYMLVLVGFCLATSPYYIFDLQEFLHSMNYEIGVGIGAPKVFYTGQFENTLPVVFQFAKILPFIINPFGALLLVLGTIILSWEIVTKKKGTEILLLTYFWLYFLQNSFLFVKWTRYILPILPLGFLIVVYFIHKLQTGKGRFLGISVLLISVFFGLSFFTIYQKPDARVEAAEWLAGRASPDSKIVSEVYDLGIVPFNKYFNNIILFNYYELDNRKDSSEGVGLVCDLISKAEYIVVPSRRIWKNRLDKDEFFPVGNMYYENLFSGNFGFNKLKEFENSAFFWPEEDGAEETFAVFDHPRVMIFKKIKPIGVNDCKKLFDSL